ncbi:peptidylprolyl isomerase [Qipengyuania sediminis]|uniref:peptidylprolyl isomerase n=1 Tax=Qipengyuania sediminis TaxID=1532023 RepID=UPI00197FD87E|nr:peptidylprolyl isomerase [Qipengyuania sediminis]
MTFKTLSSLLAIGAATALAAAPVAAAAQQAQPDQAETDATGASALGLPATISLLGKNDPNKRSATAVVNGQVLTGTDIDQRLALLIAANKGVQPTPEELTRLRAQVLRNLIDEALQIQEARNQKIEVTPAEVDAGYARVAAQNFGQEPARMDAYLRSIGSSPASLKRQIEGELAWQRLLRRNVAPFVNVSNDEVNDLLQRLEASRGSEEYRVGEIYLAATPDNRTQVEANARRIVEQLKKGGSFVAYARQFSEASTAAVGGDLGWVRLETLPAEMADVARQMQVGQLVGPFAIPGGFSILYLIDKRQVLAADPRAATLSLKQISISFPAGTTEASASARVKAFAEGVRTLKGCGDAEAGAARLGAQVVENDQIKLGALPEQLQQMMANLQIGQTTVPFGSVEDGVRVLMLCGRDDPQGDTKPSFEQVMAQIEDERVGKRAQRYLRDLRNDAYIEYN